MTKKPKNKMMTMKQRYGERRQTIAKLPQMTYTFFKHDTKVVIKAYSQQEAIDKFNSMK